MRDKELRDFIYWLKDHLDEKNPFKDTLCRCLQMLFRIDYYRLAFYQLDGVSTLVKYLDGTLSSNSSKDQMQYQVVFCIWLLTFNEQISNRIQNKYNFILSNIYKNNNKYSFWILIIKYDVIRTNILFIYSIKFFHITNIFKYFTFDVFLFNHFKYLGTK